MKVHPAGFISRLLCLMLVVSTLSTAIPSAALGSAPPGTGGTAGPSQGAAAGQAAGLTAGGGGGAYPAADPSTITPKFWVEPKPYTPPTAPVSCVSGRSVDGYAVLVGINDYPSAPLQGCVSDITAVRDMLVNDCGWDNANIHFITDSSATPQRIIQELRWLASVADSGSQTVFSFSGHGSPHTIYAYPLNGVSDTDLATEFKLLNSTENICILDSCYSGANDAVNITSPPFISMMACGATETAADGNTFTKAWVQGLGTTKWDNVEEAFAYAHDQLQGQQTPVMWDNIAGDMLLGRKPPVIAQLPGPMAAEHTPITVCFTPYESDVVDGHALLNWSASLWDPAAIKGIAGQNSANDTLTFTPSYYFDGKTNVTMVLTNSAGRTAKANITLTWTPVNDPPFVTGLDKLSSSVERTKGVKLIVYGGDTDNANSTLGIEVDFRAAGGNWTMAAGEADYVINRWEFNFTPSPTCPTGWADFRARLKDSEYWSDWFNATHFMDILNSPPRVTDLAASAPLVHRGQPVTFSVRGADPEDKPDRLVCQAEVKSSNDSLWTDVPRVNLTAGVWDAGYTPSAASALGPCDLRARLVDSEGLAGDWLELYGQFTVENAIPVTDSIDIAGPSVVRGGNMTVQVRGSDIEDPVAALVCALQYKGPSGSWAPVDGGKVVAERWEFAFQPTSAFKTGNYSFRALLQDTSMQSSDWLYDNASLSVLDSPPAVSDLNLSRTTVCRTQNISLRVEGRDYEDRSSLLGCAVEYRDVGRTDWSAAFLSDMGYDSPSSDWRCVFTAPASAASGNYEFRARLRDHDGNWGDWSAAKQALAVQNNPPAAVIAPHAGVVNEKSATQFDGSPSSDIEGQLDFSWDFGDGAQGQGQNISHTYLQGGPRTVELTVTDSDGATASARLELRVNTLPVANAACRQSGGVDDYRVRFNGTLSTDAEGPISAYIWDFDVSKDSNGDGAADNDIDSSSPCPTFDYKKEGTYTAKLTVVDGDNATATAIVTVKVKRVDADSGWALDAGAAVTLVALAAVGVAVALRRKGKGNVPEPEAWDPQAATTAPSAPLERPAQPMPAAQYQHGSPQDSYGQYPTYQQAPAQDLYGQHPTSQQAPPQGSYGQYPTDRQYQQTGSPAGNYQRPDYHGPQDQPPPFQGWRPPGQYPPPGQ